MPAGSAPKAALIDKVRIALQHVDDITDDVKKWKRKDATRPRYYVLQHLCARQAIYLAKHLNTTCTFAKPPLL